MLVVTPSCIAWGRKSASEQPEGLQGGTKMQIKQYLGSGLEGSLLVLNRFFERGGSFSPTYAAQVKRC